MAWSEITDDIIYEEGTFAFNFKAGGTIYAGQCVKISGDATVTATSATSDIGIGVAAYDATSGETVAVYTKGNIVLGRVYGSASNYTAGTQVGAGAEGRFDSNATTKIGVIYTAPTTTDGTAKILLL